MQALTSRFQAFAALSPSEVQLLQHAADAPQETHSDGATFPGRHLIAFSGWIGRERILPDGRRQLIQLVMPGDLLVTPPWLPADRFISLSRGVTIDGTGIIEAASRIAAYPGLATALQRMHAEASYFLDLHIVRLGRMAALERMASFLLELMYRSRRPEPSFPMRLTQAHLSDLLGLSVVHVNRTLKHLRLRGLVELDRGHVRLLDRDQLVKIAHFSVPDLSSVNPVASAMRDPGSADTAPTTLRA